MSLISRNETSVFPREISSDSLWCRGAAKDSSRWNGHNWGAARTKVLRFMTRLTRGAHTSRVAVASHTRAAGIGHYAFWNWNEVRAERVESWNLFSSTTVKESLARVFKRALHDSPPLCTHRSVLTFYIVDLTRVIKVFMPRERYSCYGSQRNYPGIRLKFFRRYLYSR